jgi:tetratricopeptide (TPR) repeat protein
VQLDMDGQQDESGDLFRRALEIAEKAYGPEDVRLSLYLNNLAKHYINIRDYESALPFARRNLAVREGVLDPLHPKMITAYSNLARVLEYTGEQEEARRYYRLGIEVGRNSDVSTNSFAGLLGNYAISLARANQIEEAEKLFRQSLAMKEEIHGPEHATIAHALNMLAEFLLQNGR